MEKYLSQEELTKLGIEISPNEMEEVVESVEGLNSSDNSQLSKNHYKITIDEFWEQQNKQLAIHCDEEWKANILMRVFDKMGKVWNGGNKYTHHNNFNVYKSDTCYCCRRSYCKISYYEENKYVIYPFDQVDLSKYLTQEQVEEIKNKLGFNPLQNNQSVQTHSAQDSATQNKNTQNVQNTQKQNVQNTQKQNVQNTQKQNVQNTQDQNVSKQRIDYKITVDDFWSLGFLEGKRMAIHCDESWKSEILTEVFARRGNTWSTGERYAARSYFYKYAENTCYTNFGQLYTYSDCNGYYIYDFLEVDLRRYLTPVQANWYRYHLGSENTRGLL